MLVIFLLVSLEPPPPSPLPPRTHTHTPPLPAPPEPTPTPTPIPHPHLHHFLASGDRVLLCPPSSHLPIPPSIRSLYIRYVMHSDTRLYDEARFDVQFTLAVLQYASDVVGTEQQQKSSIPARVRQFRKGTTNLLPQNSFNNFTTEEMRTPASCKSTS